MPNLGPGVDNHVNLTFTPTVIFVPTPLQSTVARIYNEGRTLVYIGGAGVSQYTGLPLPPGSKPIEIMNPTGNIYAVSYGQIGAIQNTVGSSTLPTNIISPINATSTITTSGAIPASGAGSMPPGTIFAIGNTVNSYNLEFATVATSVSTTSVTAGVQFPHFSGVAGSEEGIYPVTATYGQVRVTAGVV